MLSAISENGGASFCVAPLGYESPTGPDVTENVDVACSPDGRAIAVWNGTGNDGVRVSALSRAGIWSPGKSITPAGPKYLQVWLAGERALVTWSGGKSFRYALVDLSGNLVGSPVRTPDLNLDGEHDRLMGVCARDDGFVLLTQGRFSHSHPQDTGPAVLTFMDLNGKLAPSEEIAPYSATEFDAALECQPTGAVAI